MQGPAGVQRRNSSVLAQVSLPLRPPNTRRAARQGADRRTSHPKLLRLQSPRPRRR